MNLNFGPQHPAAHGVLRLIMQLNGELIEKIDPHIGLLHRGTEKLIENKNFLQGLPYFDRLDYVSMLAQEHTYCLAVENLSNSNNIFSTDNIIRTIFDEITRILNHLLAIACHALDVGSMSSVFWAFEEREKLMEFYERVSGARMHAAFYRPQPFFNQKLIDDSIINDIIFFTRNFFTTLNEMHNILTYNKIWKQRLINIGTYGTTLCKNMGLTGVMSRCTGIKRDLRLSVKEIYGFYYFLNFRSYIGQNGDSFDRYLIRMNEMSESCNIINQTINYIKHNTKKNTNIFNTYISKKLNLKKKNDSFMENIINHFKFWSENSCIAKNIAFKSIESPKGEFSVFLVSNKKNSPYKCKIKSPAFQNLQLLNKITPGHYLADLVTLIGTIDIVFGEIDK